MGSERTSSAGRWAPHSHHGGCCPQGPPTRHFSRAAPCHLHPHAQFLMGLRALIATERKERKMFCEASILPPVPDPRCPLANSWRSLSPLALVSPVDSYIHKGQAAPPAVPVCRLMTLGLVLPLFPTYSPALPPRCPLP